MTIDEAIKQLENDIIMAQGISMRVRTDALKLAIEALKRYKFLRSRGWEITEDLLPGEELLPGETEE
jgi:hypothetical protein